MIINRPASPPPPAYQPKDTRIYELTRRYQPTHQGRLKLINTLKNIPDIDRKVNELLFRINFPTRQATVDAKTDHLIALYAVHQGLLSSMQFATFQCFQKAHQLAKNDSCLISLFLDDAVNPAAKEILNASFKPLIGKKKSKAFFSKMRQLPLSERKFILYSQAEAPNGICQRLNSIGIPLFGGPFADPKNPEKVYNRLFLSAGMMQTLLDVMYGQQAVKLNFVIGFSSINDIFNNSLFNQRDMIVPFLDAPAPRQVVTYNAYGLDATIYDLYQAIVASSIPQEHRLGVLLFAQGIKCLRTLTNLSEEDKNYYDAIYKIAVAMDHINYYKKIMAIERQFCCMIGTVFVRARLNSTEAEIPAFLMSQGHLLQVYNQHYKENEMPLLDQNNLALVSAKLVNALK